MSTASKVGQVVFSQKAGIYMPAVVCDKGDLYQEYDGDVSAPINVAPDFSVMKPVLSYILTSSRVAEGVVVPSSVKWYFNDVEILFSGNVSTNTFGGETGHFKFIPYQAGVTNYYGLQIVRNLVKASAVASCTIKAVGTVTVGNVSDEIQFVYSIPVIKGVGNQRVVTIASGDNKYFAIREKGGSVVLTAVARMGASELTANLAYKWFRMVNGAWQVITGQTGKNLTVTDSMVDTTGIFKVEVSQDGNLIGIDTQTVMDLSDPYDIITNPVPEDETIVSGSGGSVTYTPILVKRRQTTKAKETLFCFSFMDSAGVVLNPSTANVPAASGTCTEAMCQQAGGNVAWVITTQN